MDVRSCTASYHDSDHHLVRIKYLQKMLKYKNIHDARQRKYDIRKLKDMEFIRIYEEQVRKWTTDNSEQQNNQNEETSETKWENY